MPYIKMHRDAFRIVGKLNRNRRPVKIHTSSFLVNRKLYLLPE